MSSTSDQISHEPHLSDRTIADLKQGVESAKTMQTEVSGKVVQTAKSVAAFNQVSFAAYVQASRIFATGSQSLFRQTTESTRSALIETFAGVRAMASAKTVKERIELQTTLFRTSATWAVSESGRFAHASIDLIESASAPLKSRAVAAVMIALEA